ncbi:MAG: DNA recombination protein RmuC [Mariprofundus sp.]|nr:DNA recombination protein RmuC [Mariprofundus sp.]
MIYNAWEALSVIEGVLVGMILLILVLWFLHARNQKKLIQAAEISLQGLEQDVDSYKHLVDLKSNELTSHKISIATLTERIQHADKQVEKYNLKLQEKERVLDALHRELSDLKSENRALETRIFEERKAADEKLALLEDAKEKLGNEFKVLAHQIFEEKGKAFSQQNRNSLDEVLKPMREQLGDFRKRVDEIHTDDTKERASLKAHLSQLKELNLQMSTDALNLTQALKGESKSQGNWGEMILERILDSSGLRKNHEYLREDSTDIGGGKRLRPDVIIRMPGDKHIIIDSKVSLTDYERVIAANDSGARKKFTKAHVNSIKNHVMSLADKHYAHLPGVHSPDYVLMFMPIEGAYLMAIEADQGIFEMAFDKGVAVVTPSTLYATLKLIEQLWRHEKQSENMVSLIDRASKLHDKVVDFVKAFEDVGGRLNQAKDSYDIALGRITKGPGNVIRQIDQLGRLAGKTKKELPGHLIETAMLEDQKKRTFD